MAAAAVAVLGYKALALGLVVGGLGLITLGLVLVVGYAISGGEVTALGALGASGLGGGGFCSPEALTTLPDPTWMLGLLVPLTLLLGLWVLVRWRQEARPPALRAARPRRGPA